MRLNLGCGSNRIKDCINADLKDGDIYLDLRKPLPFESNAISEVYLFHTIEHIEKSKWPFLLCEVHRILAADGRFIISYPEFAKIAQNWLENKHGKREFWEATIYGRQSSIGDYHVSLMDSDEFRNTLYYCGFIDLQFFPEPHEDYNTVCRAKKGTPPLIYEQVLKKEIFGS